MSEKTTPSKTTRPRPHSAIIPPYMHNTHTHTAEGRRCPNDSRVLFSARVPSRSLLMKPMMTQASPLPGLMHACPGPFGIYPHPSPQSIKHTLVNLPRTPIQNTARQPDKNSTRDKERSINPVVASQQHQQHNHARHLHPGQAPELHGWCVVAWPRGREGGRGGRKQGGRLRSEASCQGVSSSRVRSCALRASRLFAPAAHIACPSCCLRSILSRSCSRIF